jgi:acyl-coenzyme A thioesterase PaaI-like protein
MDVSALPFNRHLGLAIRDVDGAPTVVLQPGEHHLNHVNTVHATVIYGLAEAASGQCLLSRFPGLVDSFVAVLRKSVTKYRRPASPDAPLQARGRLDDESATHFQELLASRGRASVDIVVSVAQHEMELFTGTFTWFATARES